jgi:hydrogenase expression/formation protein HypC
MCIGTPMQVERVEGLTAVARARDGETRRVGIALVDRPDPGNWLLVHVDTAVRRLDAEEAGQIADALDGLRATLAGEPFEHLFKDLIDRVPELPPHLRPGAGSGDTNDRARDAAE